MTSKTIKIFNEHAQEYEDKFMDQKKYAESLDLFISSFSMENANILDLACGPGNISRYILDRKADANILGIDLSEKMLSLAKKNNPIANYRKMDIRDIGQLNQKYHGVICGFGLPYLNKAEANDFIKNTSSLLIENGVLYISAILGSYVDSGIKTSSSKSQYEMNLFHHEEEYLLASLIDNDMETIRITKLQLDPKKKDSKEMIIISKKHVNIREK